MTLGEHAARRVDAAGHAGAGLQLHAWRATIDAVVARDDVDHAADGVGAVECRALGSSDDLHVVHRLDVERRDEERVRDLDTVDVYLWIAEAERARAADARVTR